MPEDPYQSPPQPIFGDSSRHWQKGILETQAIGERLTGHRASRTPRASARARAIATAVFYTASEWHRAFEAPLDTQIDTWGSVFEHGDNTDWLTIDLAVRAVHAHFRQSILGHMLPAHVLHQAAIIKLEQEANN